MADKTKGKTAPKKAAPVAKKKTVIEKVEALLEPAKAAPKSVAELSGKLKAELDKIAPGSGSKVIPPAQVIVEETKIKLPQPDPATGPNAKFPYAILVTDKGKVYFDRFKTAKERDRRRGALEKRVTAIENVDHIAPAIAESQQVTEGAPGAGGGAKGPRLVKGAASDPSVSKRVTQGARIDTWRIARSVRVGKPGFFLQGGHEEKAGGRVRFIVGEEEHFTSLHKAKEAQVAKLPPSDDPEEVPTHSSKVK